MPDGTETVWSALRAETFVPSQQQAVFGTGGTVAAFMANPIIGTGQHVLL